MSIRTTLAPGLPSLVCILSSRNEVEMGLMSPRK